jgi:hypothetical protein
LNLSNGSIALLTSPKKLIKELPRLFPAEDVGAKAPTENAADHYNSSSEVNDSSDSMSNLVSLPQSHGDETDELKIAAAEESPKVDLGKSPGEIAFFKLLHAEFKKVTHFFEKAEQEFVIREERVRGGVEIIKGPNSIMVNEKWSTQAKSIYRLYKDLSLLETFAIMTYCSFSKILKKHDKVTGHQTRTAFMSNIVNKVRVGCNVRSFVVLFFGNGSNSMPLCAAKEQSCFVSENCSYDY